MAMEKDDNIIKRAFVAAAIPLGVLIIAFVARLSMLQGHALRQLAPANNDFAGAVAQGIGPNQQHTLQVYGKDFSLSSVKYFDNTWALISVIPKNVSTDKATIILNKVDGMYRVVLGPGTAFPTVVLNELPLDLGQYLVNQGVIYEPTN